MNILLSHTSALQYWRTIGCYRNREAALRHFAENARRAQTTGAFTQDSTDLEARRESPFPTQPCDASSNAPSSTSPNAPSIISSGISFDTPRSAYPGAFFDASPKTSPDVTCFPLNEATAEKLATCAQPPASVVKPTDPCNIPGKTVNTLHCEGFDFLDSPVHILVANGQPRRKERDVICHSSTLKLPSGSIVYASENVAAVSPELCFVQMAPSLSLPKLLELGYELCGSYGLSHPNGGLVKRPPLTTVEKIEAYLEHTEGLKGAHLAKRALPYLTNRSASPMETIVTLLLCLPTRVGGYGFSLPVLNQRKDMGRLSQLSTIKDFYRCDLLWPNEGVGIEYDSKQYHSSDDKRAQDRQRSNALGTRSVKIMSVTPQQVFSYKLFDDLAAMLAINLGRRMKKTRVDWTPQRMALRHELLDPLREQLRKTR